MASEYIDLRTSCNSGRQKIFDKNIENEFKIGNLRNYDLNGDNIITRDEFIIADETFSPGINLEAVIYSKSVESAFYISISRFESIKHLHMTMCDESELNEAKNKINELEERNKALESRREELLNELSEMRRRSTEACSIIRMLNADNVLEIRKKILDTLEAW